MLPVMSVFVRAHVYHFDTCLRGRGEGATAKGGAGEGRRRVAGLRLSVGPAGRRTHNKAVALPRLRNLHIAANSTIMVWP